MWKSKSLSRDSKISLKKWTNIVSIRLRICLPLYIAKYSKYWNLERDQDYKVYDSLSTTKKDWKIYPQGFVRNDRSIVFIEVHMLYDSADIFASASGLCSADIFASASGLCQVPVIPSWHRVKITSVFPFDVSDITGIIIEE